MGDPTAEELDRMIEEACVDAYDEDEQRTALFTLIEENLELPFDAELFGVGIRIVSIDLADGTGLVAMCEHAERRHRIMLEDLPLPTPTPHGAAWIAAYRRWRRS